MAASEMAPFAKTGGLGDVLAALPRELAVRGHDITVALPFYRCAREPAKQAVHTGHRITLPLGQRQCTADLWQLTLAPRLSLLLIRRDEYYDRSELYRLSERDYEDNAERFIFFSKAVVAASTTLQLQPDIIHCHDWHTGLVPLYASLADSSVSRAKTVFTINNLAYQGRFWSLEFPLLNLPDSFFSAEAIEFYGQLNCMKSGIIFSHQITTVSPRYSQEILTPEHGYGLDPVLRSRMRDIYGILNGADYGEWNPETDHHLATHYSASDLRGKAKCKRDLLREFGLAPTNAPVIGMVTRLTGQKGFDIFAAAADELLALDARWIILGAGEKYFEEMLTRLALKHPQKLAVRIAFDNSLAHKIEAGSDFYLMPSQFEPCGLNQLYSLRYGTIPIVRATGGLDDTVENYDEASGAGTGIKFYDYTPAALVGTLRGALALYQVKPHWPRLRRNAMAADFSWSRAAEQYEKLYLGELSHA